MFWHHGPGRLEPRLTNSTLLNRFGSRKDLGTVEMNRWQPTCTLSLIHRLPMPFSSVNVDWSFTVIITEGPPFENPWFSVSTFLQCIFTHLGNSLLHGRFDCIEIYEARLCKILFELIKYKRSRGLWHLEWLDIFIVFRNYILEHNVWASVFFVTNYAIIQFLCDFRLKSFVFYPSFLRQKLQNLQLFLLFLECSGRHFLSVQFFQIKWNYLII